MDTYHGHDDETIPAGDFKQCCLALLDRVAETGSPIIVTKRGRPVARLAPIEPASGNIVGSVHVQTTEEEELYSTGTSWDAEETP